MASSTASGGEVYCWGTGGFELGSPGDREDCLPFPTKVPNLKHIVQVCCGDHFTICLRADGVVLSFGHNGKHNNLGRATEGIKPEAVIKGVSHIAAGNSHSLAVGPQGVVYGWGNPLWSALGSHTLPVTGHPHIVQIADAKGSPLGGITFVAAGYQNSAAISQDGVVLVWGSNSHHKCGLDNDEKEISSPTPLALPGPARSIALGCVYSAAVLNDGRLLTWGFGGAGNLGHGNRKSLPVPSVVEALADQRVVFVAATVGQINPTLNGKPGTELPHTLAVTDTGRAYAFGSCHKGMIGNHSKKILAPPRGDELVPYWIGGSPVRDGKTNEPSNYLGNAKVAAACSSSIHSALLTTDGDVLTFGCGSGGRMGIEKFMTGLHGARSRMKCYVSIPTVIEYFADNGFVVTSISTARGNMAAIVSSKGEPRPRHLTAEPLVQESDEDIESPPPESQHQ